MKGQPVRFISGHNMRPRLSLKERIQKRTQQSDSGCSLFTGKHNPDGYGLIFFDSEWHLVHRIIWEMAHGPIPPGMCVCHHCDIRDCVNLAHLFVDTIKGNNQDMWAKGRGKLVHHVGDKNPAAKLTEEDVRQIRSMHPALSFSKLAHEFCVSEPTIGRIVHRQSWVHVI